MAGKARRFFGNNVDRNERLSKALSRQSNTLRSHNITPQTHLKGTPNNEFIKSVGGVHVGTEGYISDSLDIASGILDLTANAAGDIVKIRKYINVNPETGTTDTLSLITCGGREFPQQEMVLIGQSGDTITITHNSGSASGNNRAILCPGGVDYTLDGTDAIDMFYDFTLSKWRIVADANTGGGGGAGFPLSYSVDDQGSKTGTVTHSLTATTAHKLQFTATGDCDITLTGIGTGGASAIDFYIEITQDPTGEHAITFNDSEVINPPTIATTADTTTLLACHADGDGNVRIVTLLNATPTSGDGANKQLSNLSGTIAINQTLLPDTTMDINLGAGGTNQEFDEIFFNKLIYVNSATLGAGNYISGRDGTSIRQNVPAGATHVFSIQGSDKTILSGTELQLQGGVDLDANGNDLILDVDGDTYIHSNGDNNFELFVGATSKIQVNTSQITMFDNLSLNNNTLDNFSALNGFTSDQSITSNVTEMTYNVGLGHVHNFTVNSTAEAEINGNGLKMYDDIDLNAHEINTWFRITGAGDSSHKLESSTDKIIYNVPTGDTHTFQINNSDVMLIQTAGALNWNTTGVEHTLTPGATSMTMDLGAATDTFTLQFATSAKKFDITDNHIITTSDDIGYIFESTYSASSLADNTSIALYQWNARNDVGGTIETFAQMQVLGTDMDDAQEDTDIIWSVMQAGTLTEALRIDGSVPEIDVAFPIDMGGGDINNIGTFSMDTTPNITGSRGGNVALANLLTELANLGLITDGTT